MIRKRGNALQLIILIIAGIVIGAVVAELTRGARYFEWLSFGREFGISTDAPFYIDLGIIRLKFAIMFNITVAGIIGIVAGIFVFRKIV